MANETHTLTHGNPGIAEFHTLAIRDGHELRYQDTPLLATKTVKAVGPLDIPLYSVVDYDGTTISLTVQSVDQDAYGITTAPVVLAAGEETTLDVYVQGHVNSKALNYDASFTTTEQKENAFEKSLNKTMLISTHKFDSEAIPVLG